MATASCHSWCQSVNRFNFSVLLSEVTVLNPFSFLLIYWLKSCRICTAVSFQLSSKQWVKIFWKRTNWWIKISGKTVGDSRSLENCQEFSHVSIDNIHRVIFSRSFLDLVRWQSVRLWPCGSREKFRGSIPDGVIQLHPTTLVFQTFYYRIF